MHMAPTTMCKTMNEQSECMNKGNGNYKKYMGGKRGEIESNVER